MSGHADMSGRRPETIRSRARIQALAVLASLSLVAGLALAVGTSALTAPGASAGTPCPCSLWSSSTTPTNPDSGDANAVELGVQITPSASGFISGVRFYKSSANTGIHIGSLWDSSGNLLAQATFTDETASGWQQVAFSQPVAVTAGATYVAGYHTDTGHYADDPAYFSAGNYTNGPLTALGSATAPNGLYAYSPVPTFPTGTFNSTNYWVDVVYSQTAPAAPAAATSLWGPDVTPTNVDSGDGNAVELGTQFSSSSSGIITGIRFYKSAANTGTHIGSLWDSSGNLLAQATFTTETASGWQQVTFAQPVAVTAGATYVAGYHTDTGHYADDPGYFADNSYTAPPLTAPGGNPATPNGLFTYSSTPTFPTGTFNGTNYWVDVAFSSAPQPVSITVTVPQAQLPKGVSEPAHAVEAFNDGTTKDVTSQVTWSSSNPGAVVVSGAGSVTATNPGASTITASLSGLSGQVGVTATPAIALTLVDPIIAVVRIGQPQPLTVTAWLTNGSRISVTALATWGVALGRGITVSPTGVVTASQTTAGIVSATVGRSSAYAAVLALR